jgi:hypothetical protein
MATVDNLLGPDLLTHRVLKARGGPEWASAS